MRSRRCARRTRVRTLSSTPNVLDRLRLIMVAPTITQRLRDRIADLEAAATQREHVITTMADQNAVMLDALGRISHVQGAVGLAARAALRACARTSGRDTSLTELARVQGPPRVLGISGGSTKVVEVCSPTAVFDPAGPICCLGDPLGSCSRLGEPDCKRPDPHHGHEAHSISEPCIPQCPLHGRDWPPVPR